MALVARIKEKNGGVTVMVLINKLHLVSPQLSLLTIFFFGPIYKQNSKDKTASSTHSQKC